MESHRDQNVLRIVQPIPALAKKLRLREIDVRERVGRGSSRLEAARRRQRPPFVEHTEFTDRNALMVSAYLHAYETLQDTDARDFALKTLDFLLARALMPDNSLRHGSHEAVHRQSITG